MEIYEYLESKASFVDISDGQVSTYSHLTQFWWVNCQRVMWMFTFVISDAEEVHAGQH